MNDSKLDIETGLGKITLYLRGKLEIYRTYDEALTIHSYSGDGNVESAYIPQAGRISFLTR